MVWWRDSTWRRIHSTWGKNPMSAMRSASSTTTISSLATDTACRSIRSMSRPGVATMMSKPALIFLIWASMGAPPYTGARSSRRHRASGRSSLATCKASSRVGTRIRPRTQWESARERFSTMGRPKARVLPDPVLALPHTSLPTSASGMVRVWMGNGVWMPRLLSVATRSEATPKTRNSSVIYGSGCGRKRKDRQPAPQGYRVQVSKEMFSASWSWGPSGAAASASASPSSPRPQNR